ncbi:FAD-dependent monooxygenase [Streptomyces yunnanensis]|uniref:2-polyprenyl-6-methoxyphenol hydroxylase n=1 Tax=Streptomyces yunnanensis TaxID=156453 RepID=A0A9X8MU53_9ACTN|nr:FAD-dependent monooxygenase [Streptomyces yunnanensis]SHL81829.1 2-polyprenyl-6-methoxyphenol hydroxylase [Streptomyces yunnanensis]
MTNRAVLISGAGIAGPTLAYWLARHGFQPTVVERGQGLRSSGSPVDVRGPAISVAEHMGITPRLRAARTEVTELNFVDDSGCQVGRIPTQARRGDSVELPRFDLATILFEAAREEAEFLFGDSIATLHQDAGGVDVTFEQAPPRRFDLVIGADGLHSRTRQLTFGPEGTYVRHMGVWVATMPVDNLNLDRHKVLLHNSPGRAVALHPCRGKATAAFMYRGPGDASFDHRNTADHKRRLVDAYSGAGWRVPELLQRIRKVDDLYFDSVSQVRLDRWSTRRVALLGDAASCVSLFGDGSTLAMAGASTLAQALAATPADYETAFHRYERDHRHLVAPKQRAVRQATALLIPAGRFGIAARNATTRLWPFASGIRLIHQGLRRRRAASADQEPSK